MRDKTIDRKTSRMLKGIAILMMVSMHLLKTSWLDNPTDLIDFQVLDQPFSHVVAESFHCSTAIFAFLTGYVWARGERGGILYEACL